MQRVFLMVFLILLVFVSSFACADVIVVAVSGAAPADIISSPLANISAFIDEASIGIMNVRTAGADKNNELGGVFVTLGAGVMGVGKHEVAQAKNSSSLINGVRVKDVYDSVVGMPRSSSEVLHVRINKIKKQNELAQYHAKPGLLGSILAKNNIKRAVLGNSDLGWEHHREIVAFLMDDRGRVDFGYVSSPRLLKKDVTYPYGMRTNTDFILSQLARYMKSAEVIAVDFGDFYRLNAVVSECVPDAADKLRQKIAKDFDLFLGELCRLVTDDDTIIILSPIVQSQALGDEKLSFAAIRGKDFEKGSLLFSPSTRRSGVITMSDIAPTILSRFGIAPVDDISGRELSSVKCTDHRKTVLEINEKAKTHAENIVIMRFTSVAQTIIIIVAFLILLLWRKYVEAAKSITLIPAIIPLVMLWMSPLPNMGVVLSSICLILSTLALFFVCVYAIRNVFKSFFVVALAILATIALDMIFFKTLMASSIGGYTIVGGARYYGMGNEFMGTTLGACLFVMGYMLYCEKMEKYAKLAVCAIAAALFAVVGLSSLGANVGGAIASAMASVTLILILCGVRINLKSIVYICLITVVFLGFIFALDAMKDSSMQSHAGKIVSLASKGKANDIVQVFERKLLTNLRLFTVSLWSRLFVVALVCGCLLAFFSRPHTREEKAVLAGMISGVCAAFVFNDSGVVAGATCGVWLFAFAMCLYAKKSSPMSEGA